MFIRAKKEYKICFTEEDQEGLTDDELQNLAIDILRKQFGPHVWSMDIHTWRQRGRVYIELFRVEAFTPTSRVIKQGKEA